jgi:hypothetical protein
MGPYRQTPTHGTPSSVRWHVGQQVLERSANDLEAVVGRLRKPEQQSRNTKESHGRPEVLERHAEDRYGGEA